MRQTSTDNDHPDPARAKPAQAKGPRGLQRGEILSLALLALLMAAGWVLALHG
ncbi:MAG TPA: hypothetical protein VLA45_08055 [Paracoccaceae bacterium]|nr:hypothetical protein [Paracoccaceae bacterium]